MDEGYIGHMLTFQKSEEVRRARFAVPRAMFWSIVMNSVLAFAMVLIFLYCLGDLKAAMSAFYPLMGIGINATGNVSTASAMVGGFLATVVSVALGSVSSASQLTWAWARDGALPSYFAHINPKYRVPVRSVWLPIFIVALLSLLNLANYTAFSVIISLSTFGLYQSYFIAIACMLYGRLTGRLEKAPWSLGRFGVPINIFGLLYSAWVGQFMVWPNYLPITAAYMNYALPINALVWIFAVGTWFGWAKRNWMGLNIELVNTVVADSDRNTKE